MPCPRGVASVPEPGGASVLNGVVCTGPGNCWAVGLYLPSSPGETEFNEILHWNGAAWSQVTAPNPGGTASGDTSQLFSIRCPASSTCLAVGDYGTFTSPLIALNQALLWNGTTWTQVSTPNPGGTANVENELEAVRCTSASNCWAVGFFATPPSFLGEALHWNGSAWSTG